MSEWNRLGWVMGMSASAIAGSGSDYPHDPADLVRCVKYCESVGITTDELAERMRPRSIEWARLTAHWDDLVALLKHEVETNTRGLAPRISKEMKRVIANGAPCAACDSTGRGTECPKCKGTGRRSGGRCRAEHCYEGADICTPCRGRGYTGGDR